MSDWIDGHHLKDRVVYYRVPEPSRAAAATAGRTARARWRPSWRSRTRRSPAWLEHELARRADHACVETDGRVPPDAPGDHQGRAGQGQRRAAREGRPVPHRRPQPVRARLVQPAQARRAAGPGRERLEPPQRRSRPSSSGTRRRRTPRSSAGRLLAGAGRRPTSSPRSTGSPMVNRAERAPGRAARAARPRSAELAAAEPRPRRGQGADRRRGRAVAARSWMGGSAGSITGSTPPRRVLHEAREILAEDAAGPARAQFAADRGAAGHGRAARARDRRGLRPGRDGRPEPSSARWPTKRGDRLARLSNKIVAAMGEFRRQYPVETQRARRLGRSPPTVTASCTAGSPATTCPGSRRQFKTYLNQNTIRDIAGFQSQLNKQAELIRERIATINTSLVDVDYNPGRYIRLEPLPSPHGDIRDFRADLRACTDDAVSGEDSDHYSEQKFLQVSRIIERFRGPRRADRGGPAVDAGSSPTCGTGSCSPPPSGTARTTPSTSTTPTPAASPAGRRRSSPTRSWPPRWPTSSSWNGARRSRGRSGSRSSTRRSAAAPTSRPGSRWSCSAGSACSC